MSSRFIRATLAPARFRQVLLARRMGRVGLMHRKRKFVHLHLAVRKDGIGFLEQPHGLFYIVALLQKGLRVPLAALGTKKITTVHVDRAGQTRNRVGYGMNDVTSKRFRILLAQRPGTCGLQLTILAARGATPEILSSRPVYTPITAHI